MKPIALKRTALIVVGALLIGSPVSACIWDSHTISDELATQNTGLFELISGQFPEHSEAFYKAQVAHSLNLLKADAKNHKARNDLGAAYTKLGLFDKALVEFQRLDKEKPNTYETLSNLGVLHKKMKKYSEAAEFIERALKIKAEGHMGLGDWYLKMLRYQARVAAKKQPSELDFLGLNYGDSVLNYSRSETLANHGTMEFLEAQLKALIRNDRHFPDAYVVLGDLLLSAGGSGKPMNLAFWCYLRAYDLGHPQPKLIMERLKEIHEHWTKAVNQRGNNYVESFEETLHAVRTQLSARQKWVIQFKKIEEELIQSGQKVDFDSVKKVLVARGIKVVKPEDAGVKKSLMPKWAIFLLFTVFLIILVLGVKRRLSSKVNA